MKKKQYIYIVLFGMAIIALLLINGCIQKTKQSETFKGSGQPLEEMPQGVLVSEIPEDMDVLFTSIRYVLNDPACLDENYNLKKNFINMPDCNKKIYDQGKLAVPRQFFAMDLETGNVVQMTNTDCFFVTGQTVDSTTLMAHAACSDTNDDERIDENDKIELYLLDLTTEKMNCLTCGLGLDGINNPDYSAVNQKIVFSAQTTSKFHNYVFTIDANKNLEQITKDDDYMDFDCAWSEDGTKIVFNRLPLPFLTKPSQVWLMDSDGTNLEKITDGGPNPNNEEPHRLYPIGIDVDPDLSPDNKKIVFSRLRTGKENVSFGVYELIIVNVKTKQKEILDSQYTNMIPEWKSGGILLVRQIGAVKPMDVKQSLYLYKDGEFKELEKFPYNVFPIGAFGGSWIE